MIRWIHDRIYGITIIACITAVCVVLYMSTCYGIKQERIGYEAGYSNFKADKVDVRKVLDKSVLTSFTSGYRKGILDAYVDSKLERD